MRYYLKLGKETLEVEIVQESEKFLTFRTINEDGSIKEFRKKKPVSDLIPIEKKETEIPNFNKWITEPFKHQIEFLKYSQTHDCFLLRDDPGLGKTKQALDLIYNRIESNQIKSALIVCGIGGLQYNWLREIRKHTNLKGYIIGTRAANKLGTSTRIGSNSDKLKDLQTIKADIYIINIEALRNKEIVAQLQLMIARQQIGQVVVDEVHKCKNPKALQTAGLFSLHPPYKLGLTGTPIINSPLDIYGIAVWMGQERRSLTRFRESYCVMGGFRDKEVIGYQNLDDLAARLSTWSLYRKKEECVDLPSKVVSTVPIELSSSQIKLYNEVLKDIRDRSEEILTSPSPMGRFVGLRKVTGCPSEVDNTFNPYDCTKAQEMIRLVQETIENSGKVVIFTWHVFTLLYLNNYLQAAGIRPALIYGDLSLEERNINEQAFQLNPDCKVIIGNYQTMGTGIELTAASLVIEYELPWTAADERQAQDRCNRIGSSHSLNCIRLVGLNTVDERVEEMVNQKEELSTTVEGKKKMVVLARKVLDTLI